MTVNERSALLQFKESLFINISVSDSSDYPKTSLWNPEENSDCCSWDGVECNEDTGYVIKLDLGSSCLYGPINSTSTLFSLVHLQWLSLADNIFNDSKIPSEIKNISNLSHLNLSWSIFSSVLVIGLVGRLIGAIQLGGRQLRRKWANRTNSTVAAYSDTWPSNRARRVQAVDSAVLLHRKSAGIRSGITFSDNWTSKVWSAMEASGRLKMKLLRWGAFSSGLGCIQASL